MNSRRPRLPSTRAVKDSELEDEYVRYVYKVELRDPQNVEWDVAFDAKTGELLKDERDN